MKRSVKRLIAASFAVATLIPLDACSRKGPEFTPYDMTASEALIFQDRAPQCRARVADVVMRAIFNRWNQPVDDLATQMGKLADGTKVEVDISTKDPHMITIKTVNGEDVKVLAVSTAANLESLNQKQISDQIRFDSHVVGGNGYYLDPTVPGRLQVAQGYNPSEIVIAPC